MSGRLCDGERDGATSYLHDGREGLGKVRRPALGGYRNAHHSQLVEKSNWRMKRLIRWDQKSETYVSNKYPDSARRRWVSRETSECREGVVFLTFPGEKRGKERILFLKRRARRNIHTPEKLQINRKRATRAGPGKTQHNRGKFQATAFFPRERRNP